MNYFFQQIIQNMNYMKKERNSKKLFWKCGCRYRRKCEYIDYMSKDKKQILSITKWEGEIEKSKGEYIESSRIRITSEIDQAKIEMDKINKKNTNIASLIIYGIIFLPMILSLVGPMISGIFVNKSIQKYISKQNKYTYITSVTNNSNNKKAKVYKSPYKKIDETVKDIIDGVPEGITETIDADPSIEEDGIGLKTKKEFAYIYLENGSVYVQVSDKNYVTNNTGTTYHNRYHGYYYAAFNSNRSSSTYSTYRNSARQQSINSRTSSGGGTSSGK